MKALFLGLGIVLGSALTAGSANAQCFVPYIPKVPDACGAGNYAPNLNGLYYGPNYCVFPPFPPFNGMLPVPQAGNPMPYLAGMPRPRPGCLPPYLSPFGGQPTFPTHPYARGPRDFYMID